MLYHMDLYRLENLEEFELLGAEDYFFKGGITIIEWSQKAKDILPPSCYYIDITVKDDGKRDIFITSNKDK